MNQKLGEAMASVDMSESGAGVANWHTELFNLIH